MVKVIKTRRCDAPVPGCCPAKFVFENPTDSELSLQYTNEVSANLKITAQHSFVGGTKVILDENQLSPGVQDFSLDLSDFPEGILYLKTITDGVIQSYTIYKN
jgi:hypothetical protein